MSADLRLTGKDVADCAIPGLNIEQNVYLTTMGCMHDL